MNDSNAAGGFAEVDAATAKKWLDAGEAVLIDVREMNEYADRHIPGAMLVPLSQFDPGKIPQEDGLKVVMHCAVGQRSAAACDYLAKQGFTGLYNLAGGIQTWAYEGLPTERGAK